MRSTIAFVAALLALCAATSVQGAGDGAAAPAPSSASAEPLGCQYMSILQAEDVAAVQTWHFDLQLPASKLAASQAELVAQASADLQARSAGQWQHRQPAAAARRLAWLAWCRCPSKQLAGDSWWFAVPLLQGLGLKPDAARAETKVQTWTTYFLIDAAAEGESALGGGAGSITPFSSPGTLRSAWAPGWGVL